MPLESIGADGLTNDQWLSSKGDAEQEKEFRQENNDKDKGKKKKEEKAKTNAAAGGLVAAGMQNAAARGGAGIALEGVGTSGLGRAAGSAIGVAGSFLWLMFNMEGDVPRDIAIPDVGTKRQTDDYVFLYRNTGLDEVGSYTRKGFNFGYSPNSIGAKEFWYMPDGLFDWLSSETFSKEYVITISIPKSIIGKLVQTQVLDGHLAGVVYPTNMNAFNKAKSTISIIKVK